MKYFLLLLSQLAVTVSSLADAVPGGMLIDRVWSGHPAGFDISTNHTLSYARNKDLIHWESSSGKPLTRPITLANAEVIDPAKPGEGLVNIAQSLGFDHQKRPVALYHRFDRKGKSQAFVARPEASQSGKDRWVLRWEALGPNRDLEVREVPPPSELRLYQFPVGEVKQDFHPKSKDQPQPD